MPHLAVVGAGLIGRAWAIVFAGAGWTVSVYDASGDALTNAPRLIEEGLAELARHGLIADAVGAAKRVRVAPDLADAVRDADLVQENLPEDRAIKVAVFSELDRLTRPDAILASSTSTIVASLFTEHLPGRARCLVAHPVNPPHLVPVVELAGAPWTAPETVSRAREMYESVGQVPIEVRREIDGFILNRLQSALLAEALRLVGEGYVSPEDLDKTIQDGLGLRWAFMGPFATIELNAPGGIPDYIRRYGETLGRLVADPARPQVFGPENAARVTAAWGGTPEPGEIASRMRWRDARLAALRAHKRAQPSR